MTHFIAEICSNHNRDLQRAVTLIDTAASIGCYGVKFQLFRLPQLFAPEVLAHPDHQDKWHRVEWEMPLSWLPMLKARCIERGIKFLCTPFYFEAVEQLRPFVDMYKIASYDILRQDLLTAIGETGKPVIMSTGMATIAEVEQAVRWLVKAGSQEITVLHCVSNYPTRLNEVNPQRYYNLEFIYSNLDLADQDVTMWHGWSDHTVNPAVIYYFAILEHAHLIEFHLDLDGAGDEYHLGHCWLPGQIQPVIEHCKQIGEIQRLPYQELLKSEKQERLWRADPEDGLRPLKVMRNQL